MLFCCCRFLTRVAPVLCVPAAGYQGTADAATASNMDYQVMARSPSRQSWRGQFTHQCTPRAMWVSAWPSTYSDLTQNASNMLRHALYHLAGCQGGSGHCAGGRHHSSRNQCQRRPCSHPWHVQRSSQRRGDAGAIARLYPHRLRRQPADEPGASGVCIGACVLFCVFVLHLCSSLSVWEAAR